MPTELNAALLKNNFPLRKSLGGPNAILSDLNLRSAMGLAIRGDQP